jgi:TolA-binding protein
MTDKAKEILKHATATVKLPDHKYKAYSERAVNALYEQIMEENEQLRQHAETVESMLKVLVNQSQLAVSEVRQLKKSLAQHQGLIGEANAAADEQSSIERSNRSGSQTESEEIDHKGE